MCCPNYVKFPVHDVGVQVYMHQCWFLFDNISITHLHDLNSQHHANYIVAAADIENKCLGQLCGVTLISLIPPPYLYNRNPVVWPRGTPDPSRIPDECSAGGAVRGLLRY